MPIVCGTDFSECADQATAASAALASRLGEDLWLVHVLELSVEPEPVIMQSVRIHAEKMLQECGRRLQPEMPGRVHCAVLMGPAARSLVDFAGEQGAQLIVVASRGRSASPLYRAGGTSERVAQLARIPVLVVRGPAPFQAWQRDDRPLRLLVGVDLSESTDAALRWIGTLRKAGPCDVVVTHVYYSEAESRRYGMPRRHAALESSPDIEQLLVRDLERQIGQLPGSGTTAFRVARGFGRLGDHLLDAAETEAADLVVVGTHQKHGLSRLASVSSVALRFGHASIACIPMPEVGLLAPRTIPKLERVLVATDLSDASNRAISYGYSLLASGGGEICLLHVTRGDSSDADEGIALAARLRSLVPDAAASLHLRRRGSDHLPDCGTVGSGRRLPRRSWRSADRASSARLGDRWRRAAEPSTRARRSALAALTDDQ